MADTKASVRWAGLPIQVALHSTGKVLIFVGGVCEAVLTAETAESLAGALTETAKLARRVEAGATYEQLVEEASPNVARGDQAQEQLHRAAAIRLALADPSGKETIN